MTAFCNYISKKYNIEIEVLDYLGINLKEYGTNKIMSKMLFGNSFKEKIRKLIFSHFIEKRYNSNINFLKNNEKTTKLYSIDDLKKEKFKYDYYIAESDVIWDPTFRNSGFDPAFFLSIPGFEFGKKIVYAAGLGNANFSDEQKIEFKSLLQNLDFWSVREDYSKKYIEKIISNDKVNCVLDPTLMVEDTYFKSLINNRYISEKYILVYTPAFNNEKLINDAYAYAKKNDCKVIIIKRVPSIKHFFDTKINVSIETFLNYLNYCEVFFCDSYHGVCLSVQLKKEFFVYEREDGRKIADLCKRLGLTDRLVTCSVPETPIDYQKVHDKLIKEKKISEEFLNKCFNKKER